MSHPYPEPNHPPDRVLLIGFMGTGKSAVGASLARRLDWAFLDFDREIEAREGEPLNLLIQSEGEEYLRALEAQLTEECGARRMIVMAPGGGWILQTHLLQYIRGGTLVVWLQASAVEIVDRLRASGEERPLIERADAITAVEALVLEREPLYRLADIAIRTDGRSIETIAFEIEQVLRTQS